MKTDLSWAEPLCVWYRENARDLPWRRDQDPYRVLVSEIMLQQTRIETVIPYFERFMELFPSVEALAKAPEEQVLKAWEGLGYYSRARNLQKAARQIVEKGAFPREAEDLRRLFGVGPYTAGAVAAIAFHKKAVCADGNILRVIARLTASKEDVKLLSTRKKAESYLAKVYEEKPQIDSAELIQGLMELGELICVPAAPLCCSCPAAKTCKALKKGIQSSLPVRGGQTEKKKEHLAVVVMKDEAEKKLLVCRRGPSGLLASLLELPNVEISSEHAELFQREGEELQRQKALSKIERALAAKTGLFLELSLTGKKVRHIFTHRVWEMTVLSGKLKNRKSAPSGGSFFISMDSLRSDQCLPVAFQKVLRIIDPSLQLGYTHKQLITKGDLK